MKFFYIISFFLFMNFMLLLLPRLMPNVITGSQVLFWVIWVNAIFIFTLVLPHQASYIFPAKSGIKIFKMFKKITGDKGEKDYENTSQKISEKKALKEQQNQNNTKLPDKDEKKNVEERLHQRR
jgi:hypothetical protein